MNTADETMEPTTAGNGRDRRNREKKRRRYVLLWGLLWLLAVQFFVVAYLEWRCPEFLDPKYGWRVRALRERMERDSTPRIVLGSSRAEQGFRPSLLPGTSERKNTFYFNLARGGSSPLLYLLTLKRLLADGVCPSALLVEIFPPALTEEQPILQKPTLRDLPLLLRYRPSERTLGYWLQDRALLWYKYRNGLLAGVAPQTLSPDVRWGERLWNAQGGEWRAISEGVAVDERRRLTEDAFHRYGDALRHFHVAQEASRALDELLEICRSRQIDVVLFLMPEATEFRNWYSSEANHRLRQYLDGLRQTRGVNCIDARTWIADEEFCDGHHLLARGATQFTQRFAVEIAEILTSPQRQRGREDPLLTLRTGR